VAADSGTRRQPRLNPFIFPSDTDFRFVLLIVAVLGASLFIFNGLYYEFFGAQFQQSTFQCIETATEAYPLDPNTMDFETYVNQGAARVPRTL
jgi:hypothetical protein